MPPVDLRSRNVAILTDANVIIEAVRIGAWNAITGQLRLETVAECREETQRRPQRKLSSYTPVTPTDLDRLRAVHPVTSLELATFALTYDEALGLDEGERHLLSHALRRIAAGDDVWFVCSPDKAAIRAAIRLQWPDHVTSLEALVEAVGARPAMRMEDHFTKKWLSDFRTKCLLGG